jgi:hypothetical protein
VRLGAAVSGGDQQGVVLRTGLIPALLVLWPPFAILPSLSGLVSAAVYNQQLIVGCALRTNKQGFTRHQNGAYDAPYGTGEAGDGPPSDAASTKADQSADFRGRMGMVQRMMFFFSCPVGGYGYSV